MKYEEPLLHGVRRGEAVWGRTVRIEGSERLDFLFHLCVPWKRARIVSAVRCEAALQGGSTKSLFRHALPNFPFYMVIVLIDAEP